MSPAPILLAALLAASAPLGDAERRYFGAQLSELVSSVREDLGAKGIRCELGAGPGEPSAPSSDPASWIPATGTPTPSGLQPASWQVFLACEAPGKKPFRMGVALHGGALPVPRSALKTQGEGFVVRDIGGSTLLRMDGRFQVVESLKEFKRDAPGAPGSAARGVVALLAAEEGPGTPPALEVLGKLEAARIQAALGRIAKLPAPVPASAGAPADSKPAYAAADEPAPAPIPISALSAGKQKLGRIERVLDADERGYFATLRARTLEAAREALRPAGGCEVVESGRREDDDSAALAQHGYAPRSLAMTLTCGGEPPVLLRLAAGGEARAPRGESSRKLGPDAAMLTAEGRGAVRLVIGRVAAAAPEPVLVPGLLRLGAVELSAFGDPAEIDRAGALLGKADLAPLRALLASPPRPPAARSGAREGPAAKGERAAIEAEVYRAVFETFRREKVVVNAETVTDSLDKGFTVLARAAMPDVQPSVLLDFEQVAARAAAFPEISWRGPLVRLTRQQRDEFFGTGKKDGWNAFRQKHPGAGPILKLSNVGLSRDRTQAVVAVAWQADWLAGAGEVWFLRRTESGWRIAYRMRRWVS